MNYRAALTRVSTNSKTGPIPVSTSSSTTCPATCEQFDTCYAKFGHLKIHWDKIDKGERGVDWEEFCEQVDKLPRRTLWRHNQAGDLPGDGRTIDAHALYALCVANKGKRGFTYTHYPMDSLHNILCVEGANKMGFTVNISCDSLTLSDEMQNRVDAPMVVVLPSNTTEKVLYTAGGRKVVVCPATYRDDVTCQSCGVCQEASQTRAVIGFPAHGTKKRVIDVRLAS